MLDGIRSTASARDPRDGDLVGAIVRARAKKNGSLCRTRCGQRRPRHRTRPRSKAASAASKSQPRFNPGRRARLVRRLASTAGYSRSQVPESAPGFRRRRFGDEAWSVDADGARVRRIEMLKRPHAPRSRPLAFAHAVPIIVAVTALQSWTTRAGSNRRHSSMERSGGAPACFALGLAECRVTTEAKSARDSPDDGVPPGIRASRHRQHIRTL